MDTEEIVACIMKSSAQYTGHLRGHVNWTHNVIVSQTIQL